MLITAQNLELMTMKTSGPILTSSSSALLFHFEPRSGSGALMQRFPSWVCAAHGCGSPCRKGLSSLCILQLCTDLALGIAHGTRSEIFAWGF